jgi:RNA polymerase sigma-70 factor (ECF subfamily)
MSNQSEKTGDPSPSNETPDELDRADMLRLAAGHDAALNDLMERNAPRLFNYLVRSLQNEEDAADLAQETFARVYQNHAKFDSDRKFSTWLYAIASNLVRNKFRHRSRHPEIAMDAENLETGAAFHETIPQDKPNPSGFLQATESANAVRQAIARLPEKLRTPLLLSEYEELSCAEIAGILDCSAKAVETRLYRARKELKSILSRFLD